MSTDSPVQALSTLDGVSLQHYDQAEAYVMSLLMEKFPDRDFGYGKTLYWTLVVPLATGIAAMRTNADLLWRSLYLKTIRDVPNAVDATLAEAVLSNYYQSLAEGQKSVGSVTVVVGVLTTYSISEGTRFVVGTQAYITTAPVFAYVSSDEVSTDNDRLITARSDGTYQFVVPVESENTGLATFVPQATVMTLESPPASFIQAYAATDISGGSDTQTVAGKLSTIPETFAAQTFGGRAQVKALIAEQFPGTAISITGFGDSEMHRDTHNLMGIQSGGMTDLWCMTQASVQTDTTEVTATLIDKTTRTWRFTIPQTDATGIYTVTAVTSGTISFTPSAISRAVVIPSGSYNPLITDTDEAAFSSYQALTCDFVDTAKQYTSLSNGATALYDATTISMPLISDIQTYLVDGRTTSTDRVLVRAAVPCVTTVAMRIRLLDSDYESDIDTEAMKLAIVNRIHAIGFGYGTLSSSGILDAVHDYISGRSDVGTTTVTLSGTIYAPTEEVLYLRGQEISIPDLPEKQVTANTTVFLCDTTAVEISFERVST